MAPTQLRSTVAGSLLQQFWLAEGLSTADLARIARLSSFRSMERGETVIDYGDSVRNVHCVLGGMVKLLVQTDRRKERIVQLVGVGQTFGEGLIFVDQPSPGRAVAVDDGRMLVIPAAALINMFESSPALAIRWLRRVGWRIGNLLGELRADAGQSAAQRIVRWLVAQMDGERGEARIRLEVSKATVAASLNTTPETFSRVLKHLRETGVVRVEGREIVVPSPARLRYLESPGCCSKQISGDGRDVPGAPFEWDQLVAARPECDVPHWFGVCDCEGELPHWCGAA